MRLRWAALRHGEGAIANNCRWLRPEPGDEALAQVMSDFLPSIQCQWQVGTARWYQFLHQTASELAAVPAAELALQLFLTCAHSASGGQGVKEQQGNYRWLRLPRDVRPSDCFSLSPSIMCTGVVGSKGCSTA